MIMMIELSFFMTGLLIAIFKNIQKHEKIS